MRRFSRHLPAYPLAQPLSWRVWAVLAGLAMIALMGVLHTPWLVTGIVAFLGLDSLRERRRIKLLKAVRPGTICAFRKAFDCRKVDPWIIRATYQEIQNWISGFPVEAEDEILKALKMEDEDLDCLIQDIASRSGYDVTHTEDNPWYDKVRTVGDVVHFINHQPKIRLA